MDLKDCIDFATKNPISYLATSVGNQPFVRCMGLWFADETGFYFQGAETRDVTKQLKENPNTEVCFYHPDGMMGRTLRVSGAVEFIDSPELRKRLFKDRPFLRNFGVDENSTKLVLFRIAHGKAHFWDMKSNATKEFINF